MKFLYPLLERLSDGEYLRRIAAFCIRGIAILAALGWLVALIGILKVAFLPQAPASAGIAGMAAAALLIAAAGAMIQVLLFRAEKVSGLESGDYVVIGIASQMFRMGGELAAIFLVAFGGAAFVAAIIAGEFAGPLLASIFGRELAVSGSGFGGFVILLVSTLLAFVALVLSYLWAEALEIGRGIAGDVRRMSSGTPRLAIEPVLCPECNTLNSSEDSFCINCGHSLKRAALAGAVR